MNFKFLTWTAIAAIACAAGACDRESPPPPPRIKEVFH